MLLENIMAAGVAVFHIHNLLLMLIIGVFLFVTIQDLVKIFG